MRVLAKTDDGGLATRVAYTMSLVINPLIVPPAVAGVVLWSYGAAGREIGATVLLVLLLFTALPLGVLYATARWKGAAALELPKRRHRAIPLISGALLSLVAVALIGLTTATATRFIRIILVLYAVNTVALAVITRRHKISLHVVAAAGAVSVFVYTLVGRLVPVDVNPVEAAALAAAILLPILMWSRVHLGAHRPAEVISAAIFGLAAPLFQLWFLIG